MSTKNLSRTVIEGGRHRFNKYLRRHSHAVARSHERVLEQALRFDHGREDAVFADAEPLMRQFNDKLAPGRRWLRSQVGRPWDKVRSELFQRFDARTTAGRHILFDHLLRDVEDGWQRRFRFAWGNVFYVSRHGILCYVERRRREPLGWDRRLPEPEATLLTWLAGRRVIARGERWYWLVLTRAGGYRHEQPLNEADAARFRALPKWFREQHLGALPPATGDR